MNNGPPRLSNSPNVSTLNSATNANAANLNRLFQQYPPSSLNIPSIYQNPNLFTSTTNPNLSNLNHLSLNSLASNNKSLPIDRQDYLDSLNAATRDSISSSLNSNAHQLNHRRRPSLLQSAAYSDSFGGLQSQYIPYLSEQFRENLNRNLLARNKATLLPQHYQSLNAANPSLNPSLLNSPFNPHLAQSTPPLNFLQTNQTSYLDNSEPNKRPRLSSVQPLLIDTSIVEIKKVSSIYLRRSFQFELLLILFLFVVFIRNQHIQYKLKRSHLHQMKIHVVMDHQPKQQKMIYYNKLIKSIERSPKPKVKCPGWNVNNRK